MLSSICPKTEEITLLEHAVERVFLGDGLVAHVMAGNRTHLSQFFEKRRPAGGVNGMVLHEEVGEFLWVFEQYVATAGAGSHLSQVGEEP